MVISFRFLLALFPFALLLLLLFFSLPLSAALSIPGDLGPKKNLFKVQDIQIRGLKKVEKETILEKISSQVGMVIDNYTLKKDLEKIYALKYFEFVQAHRESKKGKNKLVFVVRERPIISAILFEGNGEVDREDLMAQMKMKKFEILDINTVKSDVGALKKFYEEKGYYLASIDYQIKKTKKRTVEIIFKIKEFDKVRVKKILFLGNKALKDYEIKNIMETREESFFSFMTGSGNFKEFNFQNDIERIKFFYKSKGYLQVNVEAPDITVSEDRKWVFITMRIAEGPQFSINSISFKGETLFSNSEFLEKISSKKGKTYSEVQMQKDIQLLTEMYEDKGYAFANVLRVLWVIPNENKVDVEFSFEKGKITYFGKIIIKGNTKTRDKVIRRELKIREGARFSGSALRISKENVNRLGFFEPNSVLFKTTTPKGRDNLLDVEISVKERSTGQISLGAGYSTGQGGFLKTSIAQNNFRGLGQNLSFSTYLSKYNKDFTISFTEPYLFDSKWTAGGDIFFTNNDLSQSYNLKRDGFALRVGRLIFDYTRFLVTYKYEKTKIQEVSDTTIDEDLENGIASSIYGMIIRDKRNNAFEATAGHYVSFSTEFTGLGGDKKWLKNSFEGRYYHTLIGDLVFKTRLYGAKMERVGGQEIPRSARLFLGGSRNLRGYYYQSIGPHHAMELKDEMGDKTGEIVRFNKGSLFSTFTQIELEHPLVREAGLKWVVFFDAGGAGEMDDFNLKSDYGLGLRWFAPIGILRFEFGFPINPGPEQDQGGQFFFDIGQLF